MDLDDYERLRADQEALILHRRHLLSRKYQLWSQERWAECRHYKLLLDDVDHQLATIFSRMTRLLSVGGAA